MEEKTNLDELLIELKMNNILLNGIYALLIITAYDANGEEKNKQIKKTCDTVNNQRCELRKKNK